MTRLPALHFTVSEVHRGDTPDHRWPLVDVFPKQASGQYFLVEDLHRLPSNLIVYLLRRQRAAAAKTLH